MSYIINIQGLWVNDLTAVATGLRVQDAYVFNDETGKDWRTCEICDEYNLPLRNARAFAEEHALSLAHMNPGHCVKVYDAETLAVKSTFIINN